MRGGDARAILHEMMSGWRSRFGGTIAKMEKEDEPGPQRPNAPIAKRE